MQGAQCGGNQVLTKDKGYYLNVMSLRSRG